jgi:hypothetical protein
MVRLSNGWKRSATTNIASDLRGQCPRLSSVLSPPANTSYFRDGTLKIRKADSDLVDRSLVDFVDRFC